MKAQMRFQKILMLVSLIVAALSFVFAVMFLSGSLSEITYYLVRSGVSVTDQANCQNFIETSQAYVTTLVTMSIVFIVLAALLFVTSCNSRRKYYITNYIAIGLFVAFALAVCVYIIIMVSDCMNLYLNEVSWQAGTNQIINFKETHPVYNDYTWPFIVGYIVSVIVLIDACLVVLSTVWKVLLMKGEKRLLEGRKAEEVA